LAAAVKTSARAEELDHNEYNGSYFGQENPAVERFFYTAFSFSVYFWRPNFPLPDALNAYPGAGVLDDNIKRLDTHAREKIH
jgi:hypothetical protein